MKSFSTLQKELALLAGAVIVGSLSFSFLASQISLALHPVPTRISNEECARILAVDGICPGMKVQICADDEIRAYGGGCAKREPIPEAPVVTSTQPVVANSSLTRTLITLRMLDANTLPEIWPEAVNTDPATTSTTFEDTSRGLRINIPYNPNWGTKEFALSPVNTSISKDGRVSRVVFGPLESAPVEGCCALGRTYSVNLVSARSAADAYRHPPAEFTASTSTKIGPYTVITYKEVCDGLCVGLHQYEVIGKKTNLRINIFFPTREQELEDVLKQITLQQ